MHEKRLRGDIPLGLGGWAFGVAGNSAIPERELAEIITYARECGITHIDTAQDYGDGRSEERIGRHIGVDTSFFIGTKIHIPDDAAQVPDLIDQSRKRLRRDTLDLLYIHWPKTGKDPRPIIEELEIARNSGKISYIGLSNFSSEELQLIETVGTVDVYQVGYNLLWRYPEKDIIPYCLKKGIALVSYSSLAQGLLTGKFPEHPVFSADDPRKDTVFHDANIWPELYTLIQTMLSTVGGDKKKLTGASLRLLAEIGGINCVLFGVKTRLQLENTVNAYNSANDANLLDDLYKLSDAAKEILPFENNMFRFQP